MSESSRSASKNKRPINSSMLKKVSGGITAALIAGGAIIGAYEALHQEQKSEASAVQPVDPSKLSTLGKAAFRVATHGYDNPHITSVQAGDGELLITASMQPDKTAVAIEKKYWSTYAPGKSVNWSTNLYEPNLTAFDLHERNDELVVPRDAQGHPAAPSDAQGFLKEDYGFLGEQPGGSTLNYNAVPIKGSPNVNIGTTPVGPYKDGALVGLYVDEAAHYDTPDPQHPGKWIKHELLGYQNIGVLKYSNGGWQATEQKAPDIINPQTSTPDPTPDGPSRS